MQQYDDEDLIQLLAEVKSLFYSVQFDDIIWGSDLNWDPSRNTQFSRTVKAFIQECELVSVWDSFPVPYTHVHTTYRQTFQIYFRPLSGQS